MVALSPALLQWSKAAPFDEEKTKALDMGTALHCILLEPAEFDKRFIVAPEFNRRTTAGKEDEAAFLRDVAGMGMTVMTNEQGRKLNIMRDSAMAHPAARWMLESDGYSEASMYWNDPETGELCRIRPDRYLSQLPVIDEKGSRHGAILPPRRRISLSLCRTRCIAKVLSRLPANLRLLFHCSERNH
jgi:exodeoxyribonuclease VIII